MVVTSRQLATLFTISHNLMRDIDGLQPQEAFDELLKYLFMKEGADETQHSFPPSPLLIPQHETNSISRPLLDDLRCQLHVYLKTANSWSLQMWRDKSFRLSDSALLSVHQLFENIDFTTVDY